MLPFFSNMYESLSLWELYCRNSKTGQSFSCASIIWIRFQGTFSGES